MRYVRPENLPQYQPTHLVGTDLKLYPVSSGSDSIKKIDRDGNFFGYCSQPLAQQFELWIFNFFLPLGAYSRFSLPNTTDYILEISAPKSFLYYLDGSQINGNTEAALSTVDWSTTQESYIQGKLNIGAGPSFVSFYNDAHDMNVIGQVTSGIHLPGSSGGS